MRLDPKSIAANVIKNNMGVGGITLQVRASVKGTTVAFADTGQTFPVTNAPATSARPWQVLAVEGWGEDEALSLVWIAECDAPTAEPAAPQPR